MRQDNRPIAAALRAANDDGNDDAVGNNNEDHQGS